jgi:hypothetical protein
MTRDLWNRALQMAKFVERLAKRARRPSIIQEAYDINRAIADLIPSIKTLLGPTMQLEFLPGTDLPGVSYNREISNRFSLRYC